MNDAPKSYASREDEELDELRRELSSLRHDLERQVQLNTDLVEKLEKADAYWTAAITRSESRLAIIEEWANDLLVYLDVEVETLPVDEYKFYKEGYDKTIAGLKEALKPTSQETYKEKT